MQQKPSSETANGGSGGHFALGIKAPRRPFCPLSAGGKWTPFSAPAGAELPLRRTRGAPQSIRIANSLPQSPAATAPSSEGGKPGGGKISENRRLTRNGKTDILRPLSNRTRPEGGAQDDQRKHGLVRIGRKEAWTEGALRTHAALRSKTAFFCALSVFLQDGERFFCAFPKISFVL